MSTRQIAIAYFDAWNVPGLRGEELAALVDLSGAYLVRLEQGQASNPSPDTLGAIRRETGEALT